MTKARSGQVAVYLATVILVLCVLAILNVDTFTATRAKWRVQDAGDAAALAAARTQAQVLNEIGRANITRIEVALTEGMSVEARMELCREIEFEQRRKMLLGPVGGLRTASDAAEANGMARRPEYSKIISDHANVVRLVYMDGGGLEAYPEPYPGAWEEYAMALEVAAEPGLAAGADNMELYCAPGDHILLNRAFYNAIEGRDWCWFHFNCEYLLSEYTDWTDWGPIPENRENLLGNSEVFSLHLKPRDVSILNVLSPSLIKKIANTSASELDIMTNAILRATQTWFFFDEVAWGPWFDGRRLAGDDSGEFPIVGSIKPEFNVRGSAAACRCMNDATSVSTDDASTYVWAAAAKPFGNVGGDDGRGVQGSRYKGFVVPEFRDVRLVPLDSVGGSSRCTADMAWITHIRDHLPKYLVGGPSRIGSSCRYCMSLKLWENPAFRKRGATWLEYNSGQCVRPTSCGTLPGGGTSHGH